MQSTIKEVKCIPLECLVAERECDQAVSKGLENGGSDTSVIGKDWELLYTTKCSAHIKEIADGMKKQGIHIVPTVTVVERPGGDSILLQANAALYLLNSKYTIFSSIQLREHGVIVH